MKKIGSVGVQPETYVYCDPRRERRGYLNVDSYAVEGVSHRQEMMDRGNAVVVLPIDARRRTLVMIQQPRFLKPLAEQDAGRAFLAAADEAVRRPARLEVPREQALVYECVAGMIDSGESPAAAAVRELKEEAGLVVPEADLDKVGEYYSSIGAVTERLTLYLAKLRDPIVRVEPKGDGSEQITVWEMEYKEAFALLEQGKIASLSSATLLRQLKIVDLERRLDHRV